MSEVLQSLWNTIEDRKDNPSPGSYTASLFEAGMPRIAQKVGEEGVRDSGRRAQPNGRSGDFGNG